jgi:hypothetical protein
MLWVFNTGYILPHVWFLSISKHPQLIKSLGTVADVALFKLSKRPKIGDSYLVEVRFKIWFQDHVCITIFSFTVS